MSVEIIIGDALDELRKLPSDSVDLCVTSPPYWGLRNYDVPGQIGLEPTLGEHLAALVEIFEEVRRVLKPTGSLFLNYGDSYATTPQGNTTPGGGAVFGKEHKPRPPQGKHAYRDDSGGRIAAGGTLKPKDLIMIPNRLAIALQDSGWWVRSEIIWGKTNPMPDSSGSQRPSTSHEKIFWLAKSDDAPIWRARDTGELSFAPDLRERCALITKPDQQGARWIKIGTYYDANAVLQGRQGDEDAATFRGGSYTGGVSGARQVKGNKRVKTPDGWDTTSGSGAHGSIHRQGREKGKVRGRETFGRHTLGDAIPEAERRSRALTPRHEGHINHTGMETLGRGEGRFLRNYEPAALVVWDMGIEPFKGAHFATFPTQLARRAILAGCPAGGTVLDPFGGAGTVGMVADRLQRNAILIELNPGYVEIARQRIFGDRGALLDRMEA